MSAESTPSKTEPAESGTAPVAVTNPGRLIVVLLLLAALIGGIWWLATSRGSGGDKEVATTPASKHVKPAFLVSAEAAGAKTSFNQETGDWSMEWDPAKGPGFKEENACYTDDGSSLPTVITSTWCSLSLVGNGQNANYWVGKPKKCEKEKVLDLTDDEEKAWVNKILKDGKGRDDALAIFKKAASRRSREFFFPSAGGPTGPRSGN